MCVKLLNGDKVFLFYFVDFFKFFFVDDFDFLFVDGD